MQSQISRGLHLNAEPHVVIPSHLHVSHPATWPLIKRPHGTGSRRAASQQLSAKSPKCLLIGAACKTHGTRRSKCVIDFHQLAASQKRMEPFGSASGVLLFSQLKGVSSECGPCNWISANLRLKINPIICLIIMIFFQFTTCCFSNEWLNHLAVFKPDQWLNFFLSNGD